MILIVHYSTPRIPDKAKNRHVFYWNQNKLLYIINHHDAAILSRLAQLGQWQHVDSFAAITERIS